VKEKKEVPTKIGCLIVITGASGTGKDAVMEKVMECQDIGNLGFCKVVTCTDRPPRLNANPPEVDGIHYHFVTPQELIRMEKANELVEPRTLTGTSYKATPKFEIERLITGENLIWRIDPSRAAKVATGEFFDEMFPDHSEILKKNTLVICVNAPKEVISSRRKSRDKEKYDPKEYEERDNQEFEHLQVLLKKACVIDNLDGMLEQTVSSSLNLVKNHHAKNKNRTS
jgi:guanylate kinase